MRDDDDLDEMDRHFAGIANCETPDCEGKVCTWASTAFCAWCVEVRVGRDELTRRYDLTHERTWAESQNDDDDNYMTALWPNRI